jgi:hypothetical protein
MAASGESFPRRGHTSPRVRDPIAVAPDWAVLFQPVLYHIFKIGIESLPVEAVRAGRPISRIALAYEAGRDGFWLARWLIARGIEAHVIHSASVAVSRERKRANPHPAMAAMPLREWTRRLGALPAEAYGRCSLALCGTPVYSKS